MPRNTQGYGSADLGRGRGSKAVDLEGAGVGLANMQRFPFLPTAYLPYHRCGWLELPFRTLSRIDSPRGLVRGAG